MMFSERTVLTFAVTMMSVFGISYCCSNCNDIELPFTNETIKQYNQRTVNIHPNKKIEDEDFEKLEIYYKKLREEIEHYKILEVVYPVLPDYDDHEADFMMKILSLGNCNFGLQIALIRQHFFRIRELNVIYPHLLSVESVDSSTNQIAQEIAYLAENLTQTTSQGRIQKLFMNTFYGNNMPAILGKDYRHDLNGCTHIPGNFVFDFEQQIELDHEARHHHEDSHGECRRGEDGSMKRFMREFKHFFKKEHCPHCDGYEELDYETHLNLQAQKSKYSSWLTDLKKTDPMFGEMYFSYAIRALRRRRRPLPQHLIPKYHGFKLYSKFHVWPELTGTFIMYYLFHCQVGESNHLHFHEYEDDVKECHERSCQYESSYHSESHDHHDHSRESEHTRD